MLHIKRVSQDTQRFATKMLLESRRVCCTQLTPPLSSRADNIFSCIRYLNHCHLPKVLKVFSVVPTLYAHIVTIDEQH